MLNERKTVIIEDSIPLPALDNLGWGLNFNGPVTHPTMLDDSVIKELLTGTQPVKFMYALDPKDYTNKVNLTLENCKKSVDDLFGLVEPDPTAVVDPITPPIDDTSDTKTDAMSISDEIKTDITKLTNEVDADANKIVSDIKTESFKDVVKEVVSDATVVIDEIKEDIDKIGTEVIEDAKNVANDVKNKMKSWQKNR